MWREEEIEVAAILLELSSLILTESELHNSGSDCSGLSWGAKRNRSDAVEPSSSSSPVENLITSASSPSTPLSFCPSEQSDEKRPLKTLKQTTNLVSEAWSRKFQELDKSLKIQELHQQKLLQNKKNRMSNTTSANRATNQELRPEIKYKEEVSKLDLEMRLGLPAINQDEQETQNNVQQQNQQQITMEMEAIKEDNNGISHSVDRLKAKEARQWRLNILRENRSKRN